MPEFIRGASPLLFDRLVTQEAVFHGKDRVLDWDGLRASILQELGALLNTRLRISADQIPSPESRTVLDYGIPDISSMFSRNPDNREYLAKAIRDAIEVFEPRLHQVQVELRDQPSAVSQLRVMISGSVSLSQEIRRLDFMLDLS